MPEPAFLLLMQHLQRPPPAIILSAPAELRGAKAVAYTAYVQKQVRQLQDMTGKGLALRTEIWDQVTSGGHDLTPELVNDLVEANDEVLSSEARALRRLEKKARRDESYLRGSEKLIVAGAHRSLIDAAREFYKDRLDFGTFLLAVRAEISRPEEPLANSSFDDARELSRFLMM